MSDTVLTTPSRFQINWSPNYGYSVLAFLLALSFIIYPLNVIVKNLNVSFTSILMLIQFGLLLMGILGLTLAIQELMLNKHNSIVLMDNTLVINQKYWRVYGIAWRILGFKKQSDLVNLNEVMHIEAYPKKSNINVENSFYILRFVFTNTEIKEIYVADKGYKKESFENIFKQIKTNYPQIDVNMKWYGE